MFCISPVSSKINFSDLTTSVIESCSAPASKKNFESSNLIVYILVLQSLARVCLYTAHWKRAAVCCSGSLTVPSAGLQLCIHKDDSAEGVRSEDRGGTGKTKEV